MSTRPYKLSPALDRWFAGFLLLFLLIVGVTVVFLTQQPAGGATRPAGIAQIRQDIDSLQRSAIDLDRSIHRLLMAAEHQPWAAELAQIEMSVEAINDQLRNIEHEFNAIHAGAEIASGFSDSRVKTPGHESGMVDGALPLAVVSLLCGISLLCFATLWRLRRLTRRRLRIVPVNRRPELQ